MTNSMAKLFHKAEKLPPDLQEQLAAQWDEELEDELKWDETFKSTQSQLEKLADKALDEFLKGQTTEKGFDEL